MKLQHYFAMDKYLSVKEVARCWGISCKTLYRWRMSGEGPEYIAIGKCIRYSPHAIKEYEKARVGLKTHKTFNNHLSIGDKNEKSKI